MSGHRVTLERVFGQGHLNLKIYISDTEVISVSRLWYSGSRNLNNVQSIMFDHHVTFVALFGQRHMTKMVEQKYNNLLI